MLFLDSNLSVVLHKDIPSRKKTVTQTKVVAFAFMRRHFITACSVKCTEVFVHFYFPGHLFLREIKGAGDL